MAETQPLPDFTRQEKIDRAAADQELNRQYRNPDEDFDPEVLWSTVQSKYFLTTGETADAFMQVLDTIDTERHLYTLE